MLCHKPPIASPLDAVARLHTEQGNPSDLHHCTEILIYTEQSIGYSNNLLVLMSQETIRPMSIITAIRLDTVKLHVLQLLFFK